jgi:hypothetical protein
MILRAGPGTRGLPSDAGSILRGRARPSCTRFAAVLACEGLTPDRARAFNAARLAPGAATAVSMLGAVAASA